MGWPDSSLSLPCEGGRGGEEVHAKMARQREADDKVKTKSTADAKASIEDLTVKIEDLAVVRAEVAKNRKAPDAATAVRERLLVESNAGV